MKDEAPNPRSRDDSEIAYVESVYSNLPRNYIAHLLHGLLGQTGFRLINVPTFIPAYVHLLSGSDAVVGIARGLQYLGMCLSPIWSATLIEHRRRVLPFGFAIGVLMRVQVLGIALAGLFLPGFWQLVAVCVFLGLFGFFLGMQGVVFNYLMSKTIPVEKRGVLLGLRNGLAGLTSIGVAWFAGSALIEGDVLGNGYAATFLLAFTLTTIGLCMLLAVREPEPPAVRLPQPVWHRMRELPGLVSEDRGYAWYLLCRGLGTMGRMAVPFYVLYVDAQAGLTGVLLGQLSAAFILSQTSMNLVWGWAADRSGFRIVFICSLILWVASAAALISSVDSTVLLAVFLGLGAGQGGFLMACQNLVLEFGSREDLPMRIAIANSGSELVGAIGVVAGGVAVTYWSYPSVFMVAIGFQVLAVVLMLLFVDEPRHRRATRTTA